jgi:FMN-dependent NADH-azoreductase
MMTRDLAADPLPAIDSKFVEAIYAKPHERSLAQEDALQLSDQLIEEVQLADVIVIAAGMINLGMPATLKSWIDRISRSGVTFSYGPDGPQGHLSDKEVVLVLAYGGIYSSGPTAAFNFLEPALRANLGLLGLTDVQVITIEGTAVRQGEELQQMVEEARQRAEQIVSSVNSRPDKVALAS